MRGHLLAIVLHVWSAIHASPNSEIADAIAQAVEEAHVFDAELVAASMAVSSWYESSNRIVPTPESWDSKAGRVCGPWQIRCGIAQTTLGQARAWIWLVVHGGLSCVSPSRKQAEKRLAEAQELLANE